MSILAYVLCVLLVATVNPFCLYQQPLVQATTATDDVFDIENPMNMLGAVGNKAFHRYKSVKDAMNELLSQMKWKKPVNMATGTNIRNNSAVECYEYLKGRIEANRTLVLECSKFDVDVLNIKSNELLNSFESLIQRINDLMSFYERCLAQFEDSSDATSKAAKCFEEVYGDITVNNDRYLDEITEIERFVGELTDDWVSKVGYCVASQTGTVEDWHKACIKTLSP